MGTYPKQYSEAAISVAEELVSNAVQHYLVKDGWDWRTRFGFFLAASDLDSIRWRFAPGVSDDELVRFVGLVFSKTHPEVHYEFVSDGFHLTIAGPKAARKVVIEELPECFLGYPPQWRDNQGYTAALAAVRALIEWRIASVTEMGPRDRWPIRETPGIDFIHGELYQWIKSLGQFGYCRTRSVIKFIHAAVPELRAAWEAEGLTLVPKYHVNHGGRDRFTTLRLTPKSPA